MQAMPAGDSEKDKETANDTAVKNAGSLNIVEIKVFEKPW
jgi:hypothetical protein